MLLANATTSLRRPKEGKGAQEEGWTASMSTKANKRNNAVMSFGEIVGTNTNMFAINLNAKEGSEGSDVGRGRGGAPASTTTFVFACSLKRSDWMAYTSDAIASHLQSLFGRYECPIKKVVVGG
jgi:hypothetical protein